MFDDIGVINFKGIHSFIDHWRNKRSCSCSACIWSKTNETASMFFTDEKNFQALKKKQQRLMMSRPSNSEDWVLLRTSTWADTMWRAFSRALLCRLVVLQSVWRTWNRWNSTWKLIEQTKRIIARPSWTLTYLMVVSVTISQEQQQQQQQIIITGTVVFRSTNLNLAPPPCTTLMDRDYGASKNSTTILIPLILCLTLIFINCS